MFKWFRCIILMVKYFNVLNISLGTVFMFKMHGY